MNADAETLWEWFRMPYGVWLAGAVVFVLMFAVAAFAARLADPAKSQTAHGFNIILGSMVALLFASVWPMVLALCAIFAALWGCAWVLGKVLP